MAVHKVKFVVPKRPLAYKDIEFEIWKNGRKFGELRVSQGNVVWIPGRGQYGHWLSWSQIHDLACEKGRRRKVKY